MGKILLVDFSPAERDRLVAGKYDVDMRSTGWVTGRDEPLDLSGGHDAVFYQIEGAPAADLPGLHADAQGPLLERVNEGARVVCFIGGGETYQLTNVVGPLDGIRIKDPARSEAVVFSPRALFHVPFERFRPYISNAFRLLPETFGEGVWEKESSANGKFEFLAKTTEGAPVALVVRKGQGELLLLPSFGPKNIDVVEYLLKDKLPLTPEDGMPMPQ